MTRPSGPPAPLVSPSLLLSPARFPRRPPSPVPAPSPFHTAPPHTADSTRPPDTLSSTHRPPCIPACPVNLQIPPTPGGPRPRWGVHAPPHADRGFHPCPCRGPRVRRCCRERRACTRRRWQRISWLCCTRRMELVVVF